MDLRIFFNFKKLFGIKKKEPTIWIKLKKLDEKAVIPSYAHKGDIGMDMTAISVEYDAATDTYIYHTGLAFESNFNIGQFLFPRSGNSKKEAYLTNSVGIADCAIYRGEIQFRYKNRTSLKTYMEIMGQRVYNSAFINCLHRWDGTPNEWSRTISWAYDTAMEAYSQTTNEILHKAENLEYAPYKVGDRVGQMVLFNCPTIKIEVVDELSDSDRGTNGFGSTDKKDK